MQTFKQTSDLISNLENYHKQLSVLFHRLGHRAHYGRSQLLFHYLGEHHRALEMGLRAYEEGAPESILKGWFQYVPDSTLNFVPHFRELDPDMDWEEALAFGIKCEDELIDFYSGLSEAAESHQLRDMFSHLKEITANERRKIVRQAGELADL